MNFGNVNPFMKIYKEMLDRVYDSYLYHSGKKEYQTLYSISKPQKSYTSRSIDDILAQDSMKLFDKIKNNALSLAYRIKIHNDISYILGYNWYTARRDILAMYQFYAAKDRGSERRRSMLTSDLFRVYKNMIDEELTLWKDLKELKDEFIELFHQYKTMRQDRKLLENG